MPHKGLGKEKPLKGTEKGYLEREENQDCVIAGCLGSSDFPFQSLSLLFEGVEDEWGVGVGE